MNTLKRLCIKRGRNLVIVPRTWEPGNLGNWETGNLGNWEPGNEKRNSISSHQFDGEALERTPI